MEGRKGKSVTYAYEKYENIFLTSYVVKKKSGKRNILRLNSIYEQVVVSKDEREKPNTICF